jgi:hypothetical protein
MAPERNATKLTMKISGVPTTMVCLSTSSLLRCDPRLVRRAGPAFELRTMVAEPPLTRLDSGSFATESVAVPVQAMRVLPDD